MSNTRRPAAKTAATAPFDWDAIIADPKRATASVRICFRADLNAEHERLVTELAAVTAERAKDGTDRRMGQADPRVKLAEQVEAIEAEMNAATQAVHLEAMPAPEFRALKDRYPPRPGNALDKAYGVNTVTIWAELLAETATTPKRDAEWWTTMLGSALNSGQADVLSVTAWNVNGLDVAVPFSQLASLMTRSTNGRSKPPTG